MKRIFFLEDDDDMANVTEMVMRHLGVTAEMVRAKSIQEALEILGKNAPTLNFNVAILDYELPDGFGTELMETFRRMAPQCKIFVYSSHIDIDPDVTRLIRRQNPDVMLPKPFNVKFFSQALRDAGLL